MDQAIKQLEVKAVESDKAEDDSTNTEETGIELPKQQDLFEVARSSWDELKRSEYVGRIVTLWEIA